MTTRKIGVLAVVGLIIYPRLLKVVGKEVSRHWKMSEVVSQIPENSNYSPQSS